MSLLPWRDPVGGARDEGEPVRGGSTNDDALDGVLEAPDADHLDLDLDLAGLGGLVPLRAVGSAAEVDEAGGGEGEER